MFLEIGMILECDNQRFMPSLALGRYCRPVFVDQVFVDLLKLLFPSDERYAKSEGCLRVYLRYIKMRQSLS